MEVGPPHYAQEPYIPRACPWDEVLSSNWKRENTTLSERLAKAKEAKEALMSPSTIAQLKADMKAVFKRLDALGKQTANLESFHTNNVKQIRKVSDRLDHLVATRVELDEHLHLKGRITTVANRLYALQTRLATACFEENH